MDEDLDSDDEDETEDEECEDESMDKPVTDADIVAIETAQKPQTSTR